MSLSRTQQEVQQKNESINQLNQSTNNAYVYSTSGTTEGRQIAESKLANSQSGLIPGEMSEDEKAERKRSVKIVVIVGLALLGFYLAVKYQIIKI